MVLWKTENKRRGKKSYNVRSGSHAEEPSVGEHVLWLVVIILFFEAVFKIAIEIFANNSSLNNKMGKERLESVNIRGIVGEWAEDLNQ